jgi:phospholipase/carboxylesterase
MTKKIDGPFIPPKSGGKAEYLVVILHGYGDSGAGIMGLGYEWLPGLPDSTAFIAPNAIDSCEAWNQGYQWFPIRAAEGISTKAFDRRELIAPAHTALDAYLDEQLQKWGVDESRMVVTGFSQGAMMAMYTMPRRKKACAGVIGYSGMLVDAGGLTTDSIVKMPLLAIHGAADDVVPPSCLSEVQTGFDAAGFDIETVLRPGLVHSIDQFGLTRGMEFIGEQFEKARKNVAA